MLQLQWLRKKRKKPHHLLAVVCSEQTKEVTIRHFVR
jgi:hypothetical protein